MLPMLTILHIHFKQQKNRNTHCQFIFIKFFSSSALSFILTQIEYKRSFHYIHVLYLSSKINNILVQYLTLNIYKHQNMDYISWSYVFIRASIYFVSYNNYCIHMNTAATHSDHFIPRPTITEQFPYMKVVLSISFFVPCVAITFR